MPGSKFDFIICGAGLSGMMLAYFLVREFPGCNLLIVEKQKSKYPYQRLWSFWTAENQPFIKEVEKSWRNFAVFAPGFGKTFHLKKYLFQLLKSDKFFSFVNSELEKHNVRTVCDTVGSVLSEDGVGKVITAKGDIFEADWVFDGTGTGEIKSGAGLYMNGWGWEVETPQNAFDPEVVVFQDFRFNTGGLSFFYLLPVSEKKAYVDLAIISRQPDREIRRNGRGNGLLSSYLDKIWGIHKYSQVNSSFESIHLFPRNEDRKLSQRVMAIGTKGGLMKSTTSYGLSYILTDTQRIIQSLKTTNTPFHNKSKSGYYRWLDRMTFQIMQEKPDRMIAVFQEMFIKSAASEGDKILGFLAEENSLLENIRLLKSKSPAAFIEVFR